MKYNVTIKNESETKVEKVSGVRSLYNNLALFKKQGWQISDISRVV